MTENELLQKEPALFSLYEEQAPESKGRGRWFSLSVGLHVSLILAVVLSPLFFPDDTPPPVDYIRALIYNPPPPPPPPLPKGASARPADKAPEKTGVKPPDPDVLVEPKVPDDPKPIEPEKGIDPLKQFGVADGSDLGSADGMAGGVEGGTVGGREGRRDGEGRPRNTLNVCAPLLLSSRGEPGQGLSPVRNLEQDVEGPRRERLSTNFQPSIRGN